MNTRLCHLIVIFCGLLVIAPPAFCNDDLPSSADVLAPGHKSPIYFGVEAGVTYSILSNSSDSMYFNLYDQYRPNAFGGFLTDTQHVTTGSGVGFHIAATIGIPFSDNWSFLGKLQYATIHAKFSDNNMQGYSVTSNGTTVSGVAPVTDELVINAGMVSLNFLAQYFFVPKSFYAVAGFSAAFNVSKSYTLTETWDTAGINYVDNAGDSVTRSLSNTGTLNNTFPMQLNLLLGIGGMIPLSDHVYFTPELTVGIPLSNLIQSDPFPAPPAAMNQNQLYQSGLKALVFYPTVGLKFEL